MFYEFDDISNTLVKSDKFDLTVFGFKCGLIDQIIIVVYLTSLCVNWAFLARVGHFKTRFKGPRVPKKAQFTHERVEYNVFLFDEPLKGSKSLKTFKISLTFRFDKL
jgi:hypothetical protein